MVLNFSKWWSWWRKMGSSLTFPRDKILLWWDWRKRWGKTTTQIQALSRHWLTCLYNTIGRIGSKWSTQTQPRSLKTEWMGSLNIFLTCTRLLNRDKVFNCLRYQSIPRLTLTSSRLTFSALINCSSNRSRERMSALKEMTFNLSVSWSHRWRKNLEAHMPKRAWNFRKRRAVVHRRRECSSREHLRWWCACSKRCSKSWEKIGREVIFLWQCSNCWDIRLHVLFTTSCRSMWRFGLVMSMIFSSAGTIIRSQFNASYLTWWEASACLAHMLPSRRQWSAQ